MTNYIETKQEQGVCEEVALLNLRLYFQLISGNEKLYLYFKDYRNREVTCQRDEDCLEDGKVTNTWNGKLTFVNTDRLSTIIKIF